MAWIKREGRDETYALEWQENQTLFRDFFGNEERNPSRPAMQKAIEAGISILR